MPVIHSQFQPVFLFKNSHLQTILPALFFIGKKPVFSRTRLELSDGDFLDLDWIICDVNKPLFILCHGLEGNSNANYILRSSNYFSDMEYNVLAWNYRGCSGEINRNRRFYHSGETSDLNTIILHCLEKKFTEINLVGFSLGGNIVLKYAAEHSLDLFKKINTVIAVCSPIDLNASAKNLERRANKVYLKRFLTSLKNKIAKKSEFYPDLLESKSLEGLTNFFQFDDAFTAPIHGFKNAEHYYLSASSKPLLKDIKIPSLLIQPLNDPFLPKECFPVKEATESRYLFLEMPTSGGHLGFLDNYSAPYYPAKRAVEFINKVD